MIADQIYALRRKNGLSQEQLAEIIGVSRQTVSKWENGQSTPELEKMIALGKCFHVTLEELTAGGLHAVMKPFPRRRMRILAVGQKR